MKIEISMGEKCRVRMSSEMSVPGFLFLVPDFLTKNLVNMMLRGAGFEVYDLGVDVEAKVFIDKAEEVGATIICQSALLTTTMPNMADVIKELNERGIRDKYVVMVGGAPVTAKFAEEIGADYYTENAMEPILIIQFGQIPKGYPQLPLEAGTEVIYTIASIGSGVSRRSTEAFLQGDPLSGMLLNAIADSALFHLDDEFIPMLKEACAKRKKGILKRLEAPRDIPIEAQLLIYRQTGAKEICGMEISAGYMLDPVKSSANLYLLTDDRQVFRAQHDCSTCRQRNCSFRKE